MSWKNKPFLLKPAGKDYLWGGRRLKDDFSKELDMEPLAETWECSTHPDGPSIVSGGAFDGKTLTEVLKAHPEYLGTHPRSEGELPILIKLIDAKQDLSVQVHPDDAYAKEHENGSLGKSELWYVLDAKKDAKLVYGFYHDMEKQVLKESLLNGTVEKYLQKVSVQKDDVFYIEAGTVHALGAGALVAEIQENSNVTYRMFDYNRVDKHGNARPLHVDRALDVVDLKGSASPRQ
ncbi:MAG: class I mannose-6-phosphate isomerase, partial [Lachnospiraceae bacterium]|nr:class I mannose-6-phosphate isomerase [Lachnospiraceae bacterium]